MLLPFQTQQTKIFETKKSTTLRVARQNSYSYPRKRDQIYSLLLGFEKCVAGTGRPGDYAFVRACDAALRTDAKCASEFR